MRHVGVFGVGVVSVVPLSTGGLGFEAASPKAVDLRKSKSRTTMGALKTETYSMESEMEGDSRLSNGADSTSVASSLSAMVVLG
jgi:hypothetical protein